MQANAIVAADSRKVEIREIDIGEVGEWDIMVEMHTTAVSVGTEAYSLSSLANGSNPFVLGYAPVGHVIQAGTKAADSFAEGDMVSYFSPRTPDDAAIGSGGHQSHSIIDVNPQQRNMLGPDTYCIKAPNGLSAERAAYGGIASVSCRGVSMSQPEVGESVLVVGQGLIGQFAMQYYHLRGARVAVADLHPKRLEAAMLSGASHAVNTSTDNMNDATRAFWPGGADIVVDTTGNYNAIESSIDCLRWRGKYVFLGWCKGDCTFNFPRLHGKVHAAYFPWNLEGQRAAAAWRLINSGAMQVDHLTTHRFNYQDAQEAYDLIFDAPQDYLGILFNWR